MLKSNDIRVLYEDHNGVLWIGTSTGGLTRFKDGEFFTYPAVENNALSRIKAIAEDRTGNLWIGSYSGGLTYLMNGQFTTYTSKNGLSDNQMRFIYQDENRDLWVTTSTGIVKILKPGVFETVASNDLLPCLKTAALYEVRTGNLWIGTGEDGLFSLKNGTVSACETGAGIISSAINTLYKDKQGNLWIGTDGSGLLRINRSDGLNCGSVYSITEDNEGSLWVGTLDRGVFQLRDSKFITYTVGEGLSHNFVRCIYEGQGNTTWIGTDGGLNCIKNGKITTVLTTGKGLLNNTVTCLSEDAAGNLWIGTWGGLHMFKAGKLTTFTVKNGLSDTRIKCIYNDRRGNGRNVWIGTENGLNRYDPVTGKFAVFDMEQGLNGDSVQFIYEDGRGRLWIGANNGINRFIDGKFSAYPLPLAEGNLSFQCIYEDKEGTLFLGTDKGLIRLRGEIVDRLTENDVCTIQGDGIGYLWLGGRKGISRIALKELAEFVPGKSRPVYVETFDEADGLKSPCVIGVGCRTQDGRLWFATSMGAAVINPDHIKKDTRTLSPIIEKLMVDGEIIRTKVFQGRAARGTSQVIENKPPWPPEAAYLELAPGKKRLDIYYTAVSFIDPQGIKFRVKLEGYDDDWVDVGGQRNAVYNGLTPGRYTFKVAAYNDGIWSAETVLLSFYLRPYFYQTIWFYIIAILFVLAAVFSLYHIRVGRLKAREKELNELVRSRTVELEAQSVKLKEMDKIKSRFFANISHEFRTPLTLILGPLEQMLTGPREGEKEQKKKMQLMLRNSWRLLGLINQLLELSKFDSGAVKLQAVRQNIVPFLKGVLHSFDSLALQKEMQLEFQTQAGDITLYYDPVRMEEVFANLLSNALKFTPAGGKITMGVQVKKDLSGIEAQDFLEVLVSDTGPGIPREELAHIFDRFYQADSTYEYHRQGTGIGLAIAREIVELHHGTISAYCNASEGAGTVFVIRLPLDPAASVNKSFLGVEGPRSAGSLSNFFPKKPPMLHETEGINSTEDAEEFEPAEKEGEIVKGPEAQDRDIILVIEDSADVRQYIRSALEPVYAVMEAIDGEQGLVKAKEMVPDLIICDIMMPGKDGFEVCREIKSDRITSHIPVILLTAKAGEENILTGFETGADDYITKPFSTRILSARIKNLIELRRQLQQNFGREMTLKPVKTAVSKIDREFLKDLQTVINENISDSDFNVDSLCKKLCMSHSNLFRKIDALSGETPTEFIRAYRLKRGAELLKKKNVSILEVALEVGFSSANYFARCFKEKFHQLPSEYQEGELER